MKKVIENGQALYTVVCAERSLDAMPKSVCAFTAALKRRTGADILLATYNEAGALRTVRTAEGWRTASFRSDGSLRELYTVQDFRVARYDEQGMLTELFDTTKRSSKPMAKCRPDGTIEALLDVKGKPLADCDGANRIVAIRHPDSDLLSEADEELEERRALAEERLALALPILALEKELRPIAFERRETILRHQASGREIVLGYLAARPATARLRATLPLTGYEIRFEGETLLVGAYADLLLKNALSTLLETVAEGTDAWSLTEDYQASAVDTRIATELPDFKTENGVLRGVYYCGAENFELCYGGATTADYEAYITELKRMGFATYAENQIGACLFGTYTIADKRAGEAVVFTMHYPNLNRTQIVYGPRGYLPNNKPVAMPENAIPTTFTQLGRMTPYYSETCAPGMCYIIQLADGSFVVIDGGPPDSTVKPKVKKKGKWVEQTEIETHDEENLYRFLCDHAPNGEKPRIAVWFMTHPHGDHTLLAARFLKDYEGKVELAVAGYNMPDFDSYACWYDATGEKNCVMPFCERATELYGAETFVMHAGQKLFLAGCEIEVLYTQEDYYPEIYTSANHLSCAFRMKFADKTAVILGDCEKQLCKSMADAYGTELKSDFLQVTHHGSNGGDLELYRNIDPDVCFWAVDGWRFETSPHMTGTGDGYLFNRYLRDASIKKRTHYHCDETITLKV